MIRQKMDEYLDGGLDAGDRAAVESLLATDAAAAGLLAGMKRERAVRAEVYAGYEPSAAESRALAERVLAACAEDAAAPVGWIGGWMRGASAVAAGLALVIGAFFAGRMTAGPAPTTAVQTVQVIQVLYGDDAGEPQVKEFASMEEASGFLKEMTARHAEPVVVASGFDTDRPGSF